MDIALGLFLTFLLVVASVVISLAEISFAAARETRLRILAQEGDLRASRFLALRRDTASVVTAIQICLNAVGVLGGVIGEGLLSPPFSAALLEAGLSPTTAATAGSVLSFLLVTMLFVLLADLVPKRIAMQAPEKVALSVGWFPALAVRLLRPLVFVFSRLADAVLRMLGMPTTSAAELVTAEELRATLAAGVTSGALEAGEHRLIENVLALRERTAASAMTSRDEIVYLDIKESPEIWQEKVRRHPYSRYPVCDGSLDRVLGLTRAEDVLAAVLNEGPGGIDPARLRRDAPVVPDTLDLWEVLSQFEAQKAGFAVVVSEYAMVVGVITYKDVLAVLVGGLADPFEESVIVQRDENSWLVDGIAPMADVVQVLGIPISPDSGPYETAGGFVMHHLRRVPRKADKMEIAGFTFEVVDVEGFRVNQLLVTRRAAPREAV
ncbi:Magnesium and cobalt efflux protein corC -like protein [Roseomonas mucosa]|uniref:Polyamine export protein n=1 Tax=Roseomonas mucosa TaxID=207340 RepID=A0A1S8D0U7_9PROT|nr:MULTISPECIES: hemolysin family protein [Roseomonas]MBS5901632.1 HlyC/CorC family transporter [Acetobacteraceae bacterium]MCG7353103.1 hemolysin family protein [Roseomonas mucosa]MCG7358674.1 hemolysin family protein [Roseomonas mucosa]MDT8288776.1 hemolysin family protein [Roseomonas mucosa]MDT8296089.1 hemolysin family protein [Roseomonas mucosa]